MASTRNNNTPSDYKLEQRNFQLYEAYNNQSPFFGKSHMPGTPNCGLAPPKFSINERSYNGVDIESQLRGIDSTNLVKPRAPVVPNMKKIPEIVFYDRTPMILPDPLVVEKNQRPYFMS
tara:strand:- start:2343 stop:2699 length:357 start_codon:yes stop_codon:yes gene_type:complete